MHSASGPVVNLYAEGSWHCRLDSGRQVELTQSTHYPEHDSIEIVVHQARPEVYTLRLRIPAWSHNTLVAVNGASCPCTPGKYLEITREWNDQDRITLTLDLRGRVVLAPGDANHMAVMRGPVVLALDNRAFQPENVNLWLLHSEMQWKHDDQLNTNYVLLATAPHASDHPVWIDLVPSATKPQDVWMAFEVPCLYRPTHFFNHQIKSLVFYDYASAGNAYSEDNLFRVWLPQPMLMNDPFPHGSWRILDFSAAERPQSPYSA
jgi:uncharacterized protein